MEKIGEGLGPCVGCCERRVREASEGAAFGLSPEWSWGGGHMVVCTGDSQRERPWVGALKISWMISRHLEGI